jgi:type I restriction enzyme S subunit
MFSGLKPYPLIKDSGLAWLGQIPESWQVLRAKNVFRIIDVRSETGLEELLTVSSNDGIVPRSQKIVTMFKAESYVGHKLCWPGDFVVNSLWAWMQGLGSSQYHGLVSSAYSIYRPKPAFAAYSGYFHYALRSAAYKWELQTRSKGVWLSRLQLSDPSFMDMPIVVPPPDEQAAIVRFLDHTDRRVRSYIRAKQKLIRLLDEQKQAIIHRAVTRGLNLSVNLRSFGIEWLGEIPEHWHVSKLHRLTDPRRPIMYGIVLPGPNVDNGVPIVKGGNCEPGRLRLDSVSRTTHEIESGYVRSRLLSGDIVIAIRGGVGASEMVPPELEGANLTQDAARIAAKPSVDPSWLLYSVRSPVFLSQVQARVLGATVSGINIRDLKRIEVCVPPFEEQAAIAHYLDSALLGIEGALTHASREIALLREYLTILTAEVVTGRFDVRAAAMKIPKEIEEEEEVIVTRSGELADESDEALQANLEETPEEAEA